MMDNAMMDETKRSKLEKAGWTVSSAPEFLNLSDEQLELIDLKIDLGEAVRAKREAQKMSQAELAKRLATSQPRLVKIEQGEASLDLLMRALLVLGERTQAGLIISGKATSARKRVLTQKAVPVRKAASKRRELLTA